MVMGLLWPGAVVVLGVTARRCWGDECRKLLSDVYPGYGSTIEGPVDESLWAFTAALVGADALAWPSNRTRSSEK